MPRRQYKHRCPAYGNKMIRRSAAICRSCGAAGEFDGWAFGMIEGMGRYQAVYGLKAIGRHKKLARELFRDVKAKCEVCGGRGLRTGANGVGYEECSECNSYGVVFTRPPEEIEAIRQRVIDAYPDAAAPPSPRPGPRFLVEDAGSASGDSAAGQTEGEVASDQLGLFRQ